MCLVGRDFGMLGLPTTLATALLSWLKAHNIDVSFVEVRDMMEYPACHPTL